MSYDDNVELEYDSSDLMTTSMRSSFVIPPRRKEESLNVFLTNVYKTDTNLSKQDMRRTWAKVSQEREAAVKQYRSAKEKITYWMAKAKAAEKLVNDCEAKLQELDALVIADITMR